MSEIVLSAHDTQRELAHRVTTTETDVSYGYDEAGQLTSLTDNHTGQTSTYNYDACGRLIAITTNKGETRFVYNPAGELVSRTLPDGTTITYAYDKCGRRITETRNNTLTTSFKWNNLGYLARLTRHNATPSSQRESETFNETITTPTNTISLTHDVFGNLNSLTTGGETTSFLWDDATSVPALLQTGNQDVFTAFGHTAYGTPEHNTGWISHGWRDVRPTNPTNPWDTPPIIASSPSLQGNAPSPSLRGSNATEAISSGRPPRADALAVTSTWNVLLGGSISVSGLELMGTHL